MLQITILPGNPEVIEGVSQKTGKAYKIVKQAAFVQFPNGSVGAISIQPQRDQPPYKPGSYALDPTSFYPKDGALAFSPKLVPVAVGGTK
jgi:hypothetical protein